MGYIASFSLSAIIDRCARCTIGIVLLVSLSSCTSLPTTPHTPDSLALTAEALARQQQNSPVLGAGNHLNQAINEQTARHPSLSGYYPIATGANAFASRSILSDMATQTIDVQYYIWHNDEAGQLMLKDLWQAAERGVVVRLLLDDFNGSPDLDAVLARFAKHPNIAVRLINPVANRKWRFLDYISSPLRINRRMHNKSMTFDNRISILGGRNIGNEYLNNDKSNQFADLDVLLVGEVVGDISHSFNDYWESPLAFDIETLVATPDDSHFLQNLDVDLARKQRADREERALRTYREAVASSTIGEDLLNKQLAFRWAVIDFLADDAQKISHTIAEGGLLVNKLRHKLGMPNSQFSIVSSYFVPTKDGVDGLVRLANQGVKVHILTNSYDATDVGAVHAGYADYRKTLLKAGISLYELKSTARRDDKPTDDNDNRLWRTRGQTTTSLHAKAFAVDDHKVFIGSYNVDPRSANLNSELGVLIYDDRLAARLHQAFGEGMQHQAYKVVLNGDNLEWHTLENNEPTVLTQEPNMQLGDKIGIAILSKLPIDWLL